MSVRRVVTAALGGLAADGRPGVVWSLPHDGDLDANLVALEPGDSIGEHVNGEVDVLVVLRHGTIELTVDGETHHLAADTVALVPRGASRAIAAGPTGATYLSIHRRRAGLGL